MLPGAGTSPPIPISPQLLPAGTKVLRLMPNLPCVVQAGAMVFARGSGAGDEEAALLKSLLSSCGLCEEVPESYINIHTGLSGSGVAYVSTRARWAPAHWRDTGCRQKSHPCGAGAWGPTFCRANPRCYSPPGLPVCRSFGRGSSEDGHAGQLSQQDRGSDAAGKSVLSLGDTRHCSSLSCPTAPTRLGHPISIAALGSAAPSRVAERGRRHSMASCLSFPS